MPTAKPPAEPQKVAAFISYAKPDREKAQEIADSLEEHGFKCWIAPRDVRPGRSYGDEIIRGIERSGALILVLSEASNGSGFVSREIERAVSKNKHIFTVRIEDVEPSPALELFISSTQWIDAFTGRLGPHIDRLAGLLAEDDGVAAPQAQAGSPSRAETLPRRAPSRSPLLLWGGGVAAAAIALGAAWFLWPKGDPNLDYEACLNFSADAAIAACDRALASGQFSGRRAGALLLRRGYEKHIKEDLAGALADYDESAKRDPTSSMLYNNRGLVHRDTGDYDRALADFSRAITLDGGKPDPYASRGWIYLQQGETERGTQDVEKALTLNPTPELKAKLQAALDTVRGTESAGSGLEPGFFGPDTRKALGDFPEEQREKLAAGYAYVGSLIRGHSAVCNASLVGRNLILTSDYCFDGRPLGEYSFRVLDREGRPLESPITQKAVSEIIRGVDGNRRITLAVLATPLGDQAGWVEKVGGEPSVGDKLDIVAYDVRATAQNSAQLKISGAATGDANCTVLGSEPNTDIFTHRCISPMGSGGAPIFDVATGTLVGIIGGSVTDIAWAYRTTAVPGLIQQAAAR